MPTKEQRSAAYKEWYKKNKDKLSKQRKAKYKSDPDYKEGVLNRAAAWRAENPAPSRAGQSRFKVVNGVQMECYRITEAGQMIGRSDQTIRDWEAAGVIPKPTVKSAHRYYTRPQIDLMRELGELIDQLRYCGRDLLESAIETKSEEIKKYWNNKE